MQEMTNITRSGKGGLKNISYLVSPLKSPPPTVDLPPAWHSLRKSQYFTARLALSELLRSKGLTDDTRIENHHYLNACPNWVASLSHCKNYAAAALAQRGQDESIGIDIEPIDRELKPAMEKHFILPQDDQTLANQHLGLWCLKEACFKALFPICHQIGHSKPLVLKDIYIQNNEFGLVSQSTIRGQCYLIREAKLWVALATVKRSLL